MDITPIYYPYPGDFWLPRKFLKLGNTCGEPGLFHNLHRLIHRGFPQALSTTAVFEVYITK
jgi:hypothetical protein